MGQKEKLIARLRSHPRDFSYRELVTLLGYLGFELSNKGATSGSRVKFVRSGGGEYFVHVPHPAKELRSYQINELIKLLEREGLI